MAATADSSSDHHSPGASATPAEDLQGHGLRRGNLPSPWAKVVRGDSELMPAVNHSPPSPPLQTAPQLELIPSSDSSGSRMASLSPPPDQSVATESSNPGPGNGNAGARSKKPAWNKPSNGVLVTAPVMDAVSWPALSESTKASPKLSADSSSKPVANGSISTPQEAPSNPKFNSALNSIPSPQKPRRGGGGNSAGAHARSAIAHPPPPPPPPPPFPVFAIPLNSYGNQLPIVPDPSLRETSYRSNNWEPRAVGAFVHQPQTIDHRNSSRRGNFGPQPRGDGPYYNNPGGRRDPERVNYSNGRDAHLQQQRPPPRGFVRHPSAYTPAFLTPQPIRPPLGSPIAFPDYVYGPPMHETFRGMPFMLPPPVIFPFPDSPLPALILVQIEYYFSDANLVKDDYLKSNMDDQGWVPVSLIAGFPRVVNDWDPISIWEELVRLELVKNLTNNIQLIIESLRGSTIVEVQDDKLRRRNEWMNWVPSPNQLGLDPAIGESSNSMNRLSTSVQKITVEEGDDQSTTGEHKDPDAAEAVIDRTAELAAHSQLPNGDVNPSGSSPIHSS